MHRVCCCNGCLDDCCTFWACSTGSPKTMTLTGHYEQRFECDNTQTYTFLTCDWTMTATFVRTGTSCANYRYEATTCDLSLQFKKWSNPSGGGNLYGFCCEGYPPYTCLPAWACDEKCNCITPEIRNITYDEWNISHTFTGDPTGWSTPYGVTTNANRVLTITCVSDPCLGGCKCPVLIFSPDGSVDENGCAGVDVNAAHHRDCLYPKSYPECGGVECGAGPNYLNDTESFRFNRWIIKGKGCLDMNTFDDPYALYSCPTANPTTLSIWKLGYDEWGVDWNATECFRLNQQQSAGTFYETGSCAKDTPTCDPENPDTICSWSITCKGIYAQQWGWTWT